MDGNPLSGITNKDWTSLSGMCYNDGKRRKGIICMETNNKKRILKACILAAAFIAVIRGIKRLCAGRSGRLEGGM